MNRVIQTTWWQGRAVCLIALTITLAVLSAFPLSAWANVAEESNAEITSVEDGAATSTSQSGGIASEADSGSDVSKADVRQRSVAEGAESNFGQPEASEGKEGQAGLSYEEVTTEPSSRSKEVDAGIADAGADENMVMAGVNAGQSYEDGEASEVVEKPDSVCGEYPEQSDCALSECGNGDDAVDGTGNQDGLRSVVEGTCPQESPGNTANSDERLYTDSEATKESCQTTQGRIAAGAAALPSKGVSDEPTAVTANLLATQATDIASGTWGTCSWSINSNGVLTVNPGVGVDYGAYPNSYPWSAHKSSITSVVFVKSGTSKVILPANSRYMFYLMENATKIDLSGADTSAVTDMKGMFYNCPNLTTLNISSFNTAKVETMANMFCCPSLRSLNLSSFNTSSVTDMAGMFGGCKVLVTLTLPSTFNTVKVQDMSGMFLNCALLASIDVSGFNTVGVRSMKQMFSGCSSLKSLDLSSFRTSNVSSLESMFQGCSSLKSLDLSSFNTSYVNTMKSMFGSCNSLTDINLASFNTANVTDMSYMFAECDSLTSLDLSGFNTANVTDMSIMFMYCSSLKSLDLSSFNTSKVITMGCMFTACSSLTGIALSSFDTANVKNMTGMFSECAALASLDLSSFDTVNATYMTKAFDECSSLNSVSLGNRFRFKDSLLPTPPNGRVWILATSDDGVYYSAGELASAYTGGAMQGVYIWSKGSVEDAVISGLPSSVVYRGVAYSPEVKVTLNGGTLRKNADYRLSYSNNTNRGTAGVTIIGINGYLGRLTKSFDIMALSIAEASVTGISSRTYSGSAQTQNPTVRVGGLTATRSVSYANNVDVGTATMTITGTGNYTGSLVETFTILPLSIANAVVTGVASKTYTGKAQTQNPTVKVGGLTATRSLAYKNNVAAGTATVTITGTGNYTGSVVKTFTIMPRSIAKATVSGIKDKIYTGGAITQALSVALSGYAPTFKVSYKNNVATGTATAIVMGTGNYTGSITKTFKIKPAKLAARGIALAKATLVYTGKARKPKVTVKVGAKALKAGKDYTVVYAKDSKAVGSHKVKVVGKGNYAGSASKSYVVNPKATAITKTRAYDAEVGSGIEISWRKVSAQIDGYEVWLSTSKKFPSSGLKKKQFAVTSAVGKKASFKGQALKKGTRYYVKIRAYKKVSGKNYLSSWSKVKNVKTGNVA